MERLWSLDQKVACYSSDAPILKADLMARDPVAFLEQQPSFDECG